MPNFNPQQPPGPFPFLDELEQRVHPAVGPVLGSVFGVGMFFYGLDHPKYPLVLFIGLGIIGGLLAVALLKHLSTLVIYTVLICAAGGGTFWLFSHTTELRQRHAAPTVQTPAASAADTSRGLLDLVRKAVQ